MAPRLIALVGGGQAAGKKSVCKAISSRLREWKVTNIRQLSLEDFKKAKLDKAVNPESPYAYDFAAALKEIESYDNDVLLVEGMYALYEQTLKALGAIRIYVDVDSDIRLSRRITRDTTERAISLHKVLDDYLEFGKPAMELYIQGTKPTADVILMRGTEPSGIELIAGAIYDRLQADRAAVNTPDSAPDWQSSHGMAIRRTLLESDLGTQRESFYELA